MENQGQIQPQRQLTTKGLFERVDVRKKFEEMLGKKAQGFMTSVLQVVASNEMLKNAEPTSVYQAAAMAATLDLPINNNLGFAYILPYKDKNGQQVAQFQMGYRGFIQLAQRSGQFKTISVTPIFEGQIVAENPLTGYVFDFTKKVSEKIIGYASYFALINGFEKILYMTTEQVHAHGKRFSQTFKKNFGLWKDDFDSMAQKTVLKLLLSKYAPLSVDMQRAVISDQAVIKNVDNGEVDYVDGEAEVMKPEAIAAQKENDRIKDFINAATTIEQLDEVYDHVPDELMDQFLSKKGELSKPTEA